MTTYFKGSCEVRCKCGWRGYPAKLEGAGENKCPECGRTVKVRS